MTDRPKEEDISREKKIDESWKEAVAKEKEPVQEGRVPPPIEVNFQLFVTSLMMEALIALGEVENPVSKKKEPHPVHAKFIIDTLDMLKEKTNNNLNKDESNMLEAILYELKMKYVAKISVKG